MTNPSIGEGPRDPEELEAQATGPAPTIAAGTVPGPVRLSLADLGRSIDYYEQTVGLRVLSREGARASLGTSGQMLLMLVEEAGARPALRYTGLYHFALLLPERLDLARWLNHAARDRVRLVGASDHFVSEALYLSDPDLHGIEIYWDRPREHWQGQVAARMTTLHLDLGGLLAEVDSPESPYDGLPPGTVMGHVHLRVSNIADTVRFYRDVLGFELMAALGPQAAFLSAGGYHHHLGANIWESQGAGPGPAGTARLLDATVIVPDQSERELVLSRVQRSGQEPDLAGGIPLVRDPAGNAIRILVPGEHLPES